MSPKFPPFLLDQLLQEHSNSPPKLPLPSIDLNFHREQPLLLRDWAWRWTPSSICSKSYSRLDRGCPPYSLPNDVSCYMRHQPSSKPSATSSHTRSQYWMFDRIRRGQSAVSTANRRFVGQTILCWICEEEDFVDDFVGLDMNIDDLCYEGCTFPGHHG